MVGTSEARRRFDSAGFRGSSAHHFSFLKARSDRYMSKPAIVLVVEDEPMLLLMAGTMVEDAGLQPLYANNADEAIAILEARTDIRIVFTDVDMPGSMDGIKLAAAVRNRWPPIRIIVVSGHPSAGLSKLPDGARFFAKPYDEQRIVETLTAMAA